jgi:D-aminopeptidase
MLQASLERNCREERVRAERGFRLLAGLAALLLLTAANGAERPRAREAGIVIGMLPTGPLNAITDVAGVAVGHRTIIKGERIRTGVTAVLPHEGNLFQDKVPAGFAVANGFGKFAGSTQVEELGELETPILLTNTLSVPEAMAAGVEWTLRQFGNEEVRSVNAVVGETNDGRLNDIRARRVTKEDALAAIGAAKGGPVPEGGVGAGTGTVAFGWKGGIGTSSRRLPGEHGGWTVGVLVQSNYGGQLTVAGVPMGGLRQGSPDGSVIVVIATDAPLSDRNLTRLARRAFLGIGRTGSPISNGSGDYAIAFATHEAVRRTPGRRGAQASYAELPNEAMSPLFLAAVEATEEAVLNSMFKAETVEANGTRVEAVPVDKVVDLYRGTRTGLPR